MFCAVSLAIVWGTTLERMKFAAYIPFALVFAAIIYPLIAHWGFGGGLFSEFGSGVQDFAGSSVVHLTGARGARRAALPRAAQGQVRAPTASRGRSPAHDAALRARRAHPVARLVRLQRRLDARHGRRPLREVVAVTNLGAAGGVIGALVMTGSARRRSTSA
jgi:Amt family ammonium transporter